MFTVRDLRRFYPPDLKVIKGINLSFSPGAGSASSATTAQGSPRCSSTTPASTCDFAHPCFEVFSGPLAIFRLISIRRRAVLNR